MRPNKKLPPAMHYRAFIGIDALPARQAIERRGRARCRLQQGPGDVVAIEETRQRVALGVEGGGVGTHEVVAVEIDAAVDAGLAALEDERAAEIVIVEH